MTACLAVAGCGSAPDVPGPEGLEAIRGELLDSYETDRFGAALEDLRGRAGEDAVLLRVEVLPTRISFGVFGGGGEASTYAYDGQGAFTGVSELRTPDERKRFPLSAVRADAPERIFDRIVELTGIEDLKFNSAYLEVDVFEPERGPLWTEGGGNSASQSVSFEATTEGKLIEQVGGNFDAPAP